MTMRTTEDETLEQKTKTGEPMDAQNDAITQTSETHPSLTRAPAARSPRIVRSALRHGAAIAQSERVPIAAGSNHGTEVSSE